MRPIHGTGGTSTSSRASSTVVVGQRERTNGWSCPWHPLQFTAWFFLLFFGVAYFGISVTCLPREWRAAGYIIPGGVYVIHVVYHVLALTINPADINVRGGPGKALFDRSQHQHVIENNYCYICQSQVGHKSKHCSVCNKCVSGFDHHCKWLNNCVGDRNYKLFIGCISSAFVVALLVFAVQLYLFISFFHDKEGLREKVGGFNLFVPVTDTVFIVFVAVIAVLLLIALALLGHLLGFHIYLMYHKMSTYDFIVNARDGRKPDSDVEAKTSRSTRKLRKNKVKPQGTTESLESDRVELNEVERSVASSQLLHSETTVKIINEVSSKAAARHQSDMESPREPLQQPNSNGLGRQSSSHPAETDAHSVTSEESLKEICPRQPSSVESASPPGVDASPSGSQGGRNDRASDEGKLVSSRRWTFRSVPDIDDAGNFSTRPCSVDSSSPPGVNNAPPSGSQGDRNDRASDEGELMPSKRWTFRPVPDIDDAGNFSTRFNDSDVARSCDDTETAPRKKKKKRKLREGAKRGGELPPLSVRPGRPLPVLRLQDDTSEINS